ncbi:MAG: Asp-tRNA(Asn)/Glu-tRNA(Gln) amidotransferase subunit GatB [Planctomycetaceae bacterium]|nr:Asp-tRNA(Asn)/Glu-tRNA(Gln) amidotransferase subunit GatB [Planctomycetaceae bacterium]
MKPTVVVGLEVHVQLLTRTKIFCGCVNRFNPDAPNTQTCPVCLGLPGALPVMNEEAFRLSLMTAMALNCELARFTKWDRKQYYYPDLPKAYQISQYDLPFSHDGWLDVSTDDCGSRKIRINRAHLEEDAGKNTHDESGRGGDSQVDLNRCGTPLLEIVSEPDIRSAAEAKAYLEELHLLLTYIGVSDCNMQEGSLRCDANVNLHIEQDDGETIATPIVEVKNLNSFRGVEAAITYEAERQQKEFAETGRKLGDPGVEKETRGWSAERNVTFAQRGKEEASDYRYFPDPDLMPVTVSDEQITAIRESLCEFPAARRSRFEQDYGLSNYDASVIINQGEEFADYFESVAQGCGDGKQAANWVTQNVQRELNERQLEIDAFPVCTEVLSSLLKRIVDGELTVKGAREVFDELLTGHDAGTPASVDRITSIIDEKGLAVSTDTGEMDAVIDAAMAAHEKAVEDIRGGKLQAAGPLVGAVMKQLMGADPKTVRQRIIDRVKGT